MISKKVVKMLNEQINKEFFSAYLYLAFANYYIQRGLNGFGNWYTVQAMEERDHAMLFMKYMQNNGLPVTLEALEKPEGTYQNDMEPLKAGLEHERFITDSIHQIYAAALAENDYRTIKFLDWFVTEQAEEETNAEELISNMELFGNSSQGLYALNNEYAARVHTPPSLVL